MDGKMAATHKNAVSLRSLGQIKRIMGIHLRKNPALPVTAAYTSSSNRNIAIKRTNIIKPRKLRFLGQNNYFNDYKE